MNFFSIILFLVDWIWCLIIPLLGSLHLVSMKYNKENTDKSHLFCHWCYYWIIYAIIGVLFGFVCFFISRLEGLMYLLRILILSVIVNPQFGFLSIIVEKSKNSIGDFSEIKEKAANKLVGFITKDKKKEQ